MNRKSLLISALLVTLAFYGGMRYERYFLTKQFMRVANHVVAQYQNALGSMKQQLDQKRYPNTGAENEKYDL